MTKFGPHGNSLSFYNQGNLHTYQSMKWIADMGLNAFEYPAGKGVKISEETCKKIGEEASKYNIAISLHAPYYLNLANTEVEKREKSIEHIFDSLKALKAMGGKRLVFHCGYYMGQSSGQTLKRIKEEIVTVIERMKEQGYEDILLCPETLGKKGQFGTVEEIVSVCKISKQLVPCVDFGHVYARSLGKINSTKQFEEVLQTISDGLGEETMQKLHIHFSHIEYTNAGEKVHHTLSNTQWGPDFNFLAKALINKKCEPIIICESRDVMAEDAVLMREIYNTISL